MIKNLKALSAIIIFVVFSAQTTVNHHTFGRVNDIRVKDLKYKMSPRRGVKKMSYVSKVGGIAFEEEARPSSSFYPKPVKLTYNTYRDDGERLVITMNDGSNVIIPIPDWQLKPIALYADSEYYSCFSLFGTTGNKDNDEMLMKKYNLQHIASFHSEFKNTLVGLRLMQMDSFYLLDSFTDIPTNTYSMDGYLNENTLRYYMEILNSAKEIQKILNSEKYTAYVIIDDPAGISFSISNDRLQLTGSLYIHFWKAKPINRDLLERKVNEQIQLNKMAEDLWQKYQTPEYVIPYNFTPESIIPENSTPESIIPYNFSPESIIPDNFSPESIIPDNSTPNFLLSEILNDKDLLTSEIYQQAEKERIRNEIIKDNIDTYYIPEHVGSISKALYEKNHLLNIVNRPAYDAAVNVMRYSAFFRYIKNNYPIVWVQFLLSEEFRKIEVKPEILTPNVIFNNNKWIP